MGAAGPVLAGVILVVGLFAGWHANRAHSAHGDVKSGRGRLHGFRRTRLRSGLLTIVLLIVAFMMLKDFAQH
ncbi:MAG: hypothetical protein ABJB47_16390 [Actinomycetota bacterium]